MLIYLRMAGLALSVALLVGAYFLGREHGIESGQGALRSLREQIGEASADALLRAQEAAHEAKERTEQAQHVIDESKRLVAESEASRAATAGDYERRLRDALARTCRSGQVLADRVPEAARTEPAGSEAAGVLPQPDIGSRLAAVVDDVERLNDNYGFCLRAYRTLERDK